MPIIEVKNLRKEFRVKIKEPGFKGALKSIIMPKTRLVKAVDGISFEIKEGELVGFIGPNGAGKSTTIKIMTGILFPTSGNISVLGLNPQKERIKLAYKIGTIFGQRQQLWYHLPAIDTFRLFGKIYEIPDKEFDKRLKELVKTLEVESFMDSPVRKLSLGQRMRCEFLASLLHKPKVLFLDEPTIGLDILAKKNIREYIKRINETEKTTIILTSHDLDDIEELCPRVIVINNGKILYDGSTANLKKQLKYKIVELFTDEKIKEIPNLKDVKIIEKSDFKIKLQINKNTVSVKKVLDVYLNRYDVADIVIEDPPIEKVIERLYRK